MQGASREALIAARQSLTDLSVSQPDAEGISSVADGLFAVVRLLDKETTLRRTLGDPMTAASAKTALLENLLGQQLAPLALQVLSGVVALRWSGARDLVDAVEVLAVQAVFLVANAEGALDDVEDELFRFARIIARDPALRPVLTDRSLPAENKRALLVGLLEGKVRPASLRIIEQLVLSPRGRTLEVSLEEYASYAADVRARTLAQVTSAVLLTEEQQTRLTASLTRAFGRTVQLQLEIDPTVVGGLVVQVGDEIIDGSIVRRLSEVQRRFAS